jgi:hypothetical protein
MASELLRSVREQLQVYLLGVVDIADFQEAFGPMARRLRNAGAADDLVGGIQLRLAEYKRGDWSEPQLRARLLELLPVRTLGSVAGTAEPWQSHSRPGLHIASTSPFDAPATSE